MQRLLTDLAKPILPHFSAGRAQVHLGETRGHFGDPAGWLEGFARPLWGLVPLTAGGGEFEHWELWQKGIASGTDPTHPEYWGLAGDMDQRSVEQAAFGLGLAIAPDKLWEPLSIATKEQLTAWLDNINKVKLVHSNWLFFRVLVNLGLRSRGLAWARETVEADLVEIEKFHVTGGWSADGGNGPPYKDGRLGDYYIPWAIQFYALVYTKFLGQDDKERCDRFVERARLFAQDFQYYFDAHGAALPFGRSLTYRFAQGAFWGALAFADIEALPWPVIKGLYMRHLRWWMRQPIFTEAGVLTIGYTYPNLLVAESYNSSQSPYWAFKIFLPLALREDHPFWKAEEAPLPSRRAIHTVPGAKLVLVTDPRTHDVTAINPGQPVLDWPRNAIHKYSKCAYSTRFAFAVPSSAPTPTEGALDNGLSLSDDDRYFRVRDQCLDAEVKDGVAYSRAPYWPDVEVRTWLIAQQTGHIRIHHLRTARKLAALEGGFAVSWTARAALTTEIAEKVVVRTPWGAAALRNVFGKRTGEIVDLGANSHLMASLSTMPVLRSTHDPGEYWLACWAGGAETSDDFHEATRFSVIIEGAQCRLMRNDELWWSTTGSQCGTSSAARLRSLEEPA